MKCNYALSSRHANDQLHATAGTWTGKVSTGMDGPTSSLPGQFVTHHCTNFFGHHVSRTRQSIAAPLRMPSRTYQNGSNRTRPLSRKDSTITRSPCLCVRTSSNFRLQAGWRQQLIGTIAAPPDTCLQNWHHRPLSSGGMPCWEVRSGNTIGSASGFYRSLVPAAIRNLPLSACWIAFDGLRHS